MCERERVLPNHLRRKVLAATVTTVCMAAFMANDNDGEMGLRCGCW